MSRDRLNSVGRNTVHAAHNSPAVLTERGSRGSLKDRFKRKRKNMRISKNRVLEPVEKSQDIIPYIYICACVALSNSTIHRPLIGYRAGSVDDCI